ncbi:MAG TPA: hypothetical protein VFV67_24300 [Actinophytocola sp.]|nr:hypothetical protein [Actinophytocola sp.]HEU5473780.1 hypothetical protein [Actinophytocola sp.]
MDFANRDDDAKKKEQAEQEAREAELRRLHEETQRRKNKGN